MNEKRRSRPKDSTARQARILEAKTGGHLFMKLLQSKGVDFIFGTTGAGMPDIQDAMVVVKPPKWIQGLHEFVSVNAASGYALASGNIGVALIDRIVGTQNSVGAFYGAYLNSSPTVIFASANVPGVQMETGAPELHYSGNQVLMVSQWVKWSGQLNSLETLPDDIDKLFHLAISEHRGPVYYTLRQDLMAKKLSNQIVHVPGNDEPSTSNRVPDDKTVERIVDLLNESNSPEIIVSHLGRNRSAVDSLVRFANHFGIGVRERRFFMNYPISDLLHLGFIYRYDFPAVESDLVLAMEIGFLPPQKFPHGTNVIDLYSDPLHRQDVYAGGDYGASLFPSSLRICCDLGPTLEKILTKGTSFDRNLAKKRREKIGKNHDRMMREWRARAKEEFQSDKFNDWSIGYVINRHKQDDMVWVNGTASSWMTLLKTVELDRPGTYFSNPSGHLGMTVGMAYGVSLAKRRYENVKQEKKYSIGEISKGNSFTLCTVGDGDAIFGNIDSALWTCSHYGIGVLYLILNNSCWAAEWDPIENSSQHWSKKAGDYECLDVDRPTIDFSKIAEGFGVYSESASSAKEFESVYLDALREIRSDRPALINLKMAKYTGGASVVA